MEKDFSLYELDDRVTLKSKNGVGTDLFGFVSFIDRELKTMSITVARGCHRSEDTIRVISFYDQDDVILGWSDPELAERQLTRRPCPCYRGKETSKK